MESKKPNNFETEWQKAFNDASFPPPSDMWERIEHDLEKKKRRPFLFFLRPSAMLAGVAATLILALGGILFFNKQASQAVTETPQKKTNTQSQINQKNSINIIKPAKPLIALGASPFVSVEANIIKKRGSNLKKSRQTLESSILTATNLARLSSDLLPTGTDISTDNQNVASTMPHSNIQTNINDVLNQNETHANSNLSLLKYREYQYFGSRYTLKRNKLLFDAAESEVPVIASKDSKFWIGIQSGLAPFDPNMQLGGLNTIALVQADTYAKVSNLPSLGAMPSTQPQSPGKVIVSQPQNAIKSGLGINTGFAMGYKISKKWNFESGIRYLRGNSTLESNTYSFQQNGYVNTFFADYLIQNASNQGLKTMNNLIHTVVADASQFGNRYEYLMIPIQVAYEIGLSKKVALNLLAGVSTDIFLQNTIINDNSILQQKSTINNTNNIYKPLNLSGLGGIRASYMVSKHWQLNLGSSYQHSLFSGIQHSTALQMRLKMFGLNYGLNYRF